MRRVASVILFVLGGWLLASEGMIAWYDGGAGLGIQLAMVAWFLVIAAVPLALATWASPRNRLAELGLTLMVGAGVAAVCTLAVFVVMSDPAIAQMMPPDQQIPKVAINPILAAINLVLIGGAVLRCAGRSPGRGTRSRSSSKFSTEPSRPRFGRSDNRTVIVGA